MLKSLFGISIPTALLPGIGASIRSERAARAIARSSASASIRETRTSTAGWTSYWVTTGPALRVSIWAVIPKLASFLMMISSFRAWAAGLPPGSVGLAMSSSSASGGRTYSIRSFVGGESPASVMSSRRANRARWIGDERGRGERRRRRGPGRTSPTSGPCWARRPGSVRSSMSPSPPFDHRPVWPGAGGPAATPGATAPACDDRLVAAARWRRPSGRAASTQPPSSRTSGPCVVAGWSRSLGRTLKPIINPIATRAMRMTTAPGAVNKRRQRRREEPAEVAAATAADDLDDADQREVGDRGPERASGPSPSPDSGRDPTPGTSRRPAAGTAATSGGCRTTGRRSRSTTRSERPRPGGSGR